MEAASAWKAPATTGLRSGFCCSNGTACFRVPAVPLWDPARLPNGAGETWQRSVSGLEADTPLTFRPGRGRALTPDPLRPRCVVCLLFSACPPPHALQACDRAGPASADGRLHPPSAPGLLPDTLLGSSVPESPPSPWDQAVVQGSLGGHLPACRCLIAGKPAHAHTHSLGLSLQHQQVRCHRAFWAFKPSTPPPLQVLLQNMHCWGSPGGPPGPLRPGRPGSCPSEAQAGSSGPPWPSHSCPPILPRKRKGGLGRSRRVTVGGRCFPSAPPRRALASGKSRSESSQSQPTFQASSSVCHSLLTGRKHCCVSLASPQGRGFQQLGATLVGVIYLFVCFRPGCTPTCAQL